jgi:hypothetical protein
MIVKALVLIIAVVMLTGCESAAKEFVDRMSADDIHLVCALYRTTGNYKRSEAAFASGYTLSDPNAKEVFAEIVSRC